MTVSEMLERMTSREFAEWMATDADEPIGGMRSDLQAGIIAATIANVNRGKNSKVFSPTDFMPLLKATERARDDGFAEARALKTALMKLPSRKRG